MRFDDNEIKQIEEIAERVCARNQKQPSLELLDDDTLKRVREYTIISHKPFLNKRELAIYLDVSTRSIAEWMARPTDQNPLPASNAGGEPRFQRQRVDEWAERENQRRRLRLAG